MKYRIEKELDKKYFVITKHNKIDNQYELSVISENKIDGFLPVFWKKINGDNIFKYEISETINMTNKFPYQALKKKQIIELFNAIVNAIENAENYLLSLESIVLIPDLIFYDGEKPSFCYLPSYRQDLSVSFKKLAKWMLRHIDYEDSESVKFIYELNTEIEKGEFNIYDANKFFQEQTEEKKNESLICSDKKQEISLAAQRFYEDGIFEKKYSADENMNLDENEKQRTEGISKKRIVTICTLFVLLFISSSVYFLSNGGSILKILISAVICIFLCAYCFDKQLSVTKKLRASMDKIKDSGECIEDINWSNIY